MGFVLVAIIFLDGSMMVNPLGIFETEAQCQVIRSIVEKKAPKPKINFESVCVKTDQLDSA